MMTTQTRAGARALVAPRRRINLSGAGLTAFTYVIAILFFFPVLWTVLTGFKSEGSAVAQPPTFLFQPTLENYRTALVPALNRLRVSNSCRRRFEIAWKRYSQRLLIDLAPNIILPRFRPPTEQIFCRWARGEAEFSG